MCPNCFWCLEMANLEHLLRKFEAVFPYVFHLFALSNAAGLQRLKCRRAVAVMAMTALAALPVARAAVPVAVPARLGSEPRLRPTANQSRGIAAPCGLIMVSTAAFDFCRGGVRHPRRRGWITAVRSTVVSPFGEETKVEEVEEAKKESETESKTEKPKLSLTWDNVQEVLDELRPYLKSDGGDCKIVDIDGPLTLKERIPEVEEVVAVTPEQEPLTTAGVEEVLNGIRPFLSVSSGSIEIFELGEENDKVVLKMMGPPLKSMAVRVEVQNRIKRKYPAVQEVTIVGEDGKAPSSA
eukprot:s188_g30.t1